MPNINRKFKINLSGSGDKLTIYLNEKIVKSKDIAQSKFLFLMMEHIS